MEKDLIVWCLEAPDSNFLKEVITHGTGQRLLFTDAWADLKLKFATKEHAEKFQKDFRLYWLEINDHIISGDCMKENTE